MHPQAIIIDASGDETSIFHQGMRVQVKSMNVPLVELPKDSTSQLAYLAKLDSSSLAGRYHTTLFPSKALTGGSLAQS